MSPIPFRVFQAFAPACRLFAAAAPFGMLFGALAVDNGLTVGEAVLMSGLVFAGASQMVGLELFSSHIAPWIIVLSVFAVNFRHVLYSAALGRRMGLMPEWQKAIAFFFLTDPPICGVGGSGGPEGAGDADLVHGHGAAIMCLWVLEAWIGALFGRLINDPAAPRD